MATPTIVKMMSAERRVLCGMLRRNDPDVCEICDILYLHYWGAYGALLMKDGLQAVLDLGKPSCVE